MCDCRFELLERAKRRAAAWSLEATSTGSSRIRSMSDGFATGGRSTTACTARSSTLRRGIASNVGLRSKRKRGQILIAMSNASSRVSSLTTGATGWAQAMPPKADGAGATTFRERSSKVAAQTPDPSRASLRPRSRSRCWMRSKASSHPNVRTSGGRPVRPGNHAKRYPVMRMCSTRSSESRLARSRSRSGSASLSPSMAQVEH